MIAIAERRDEIVNLLRACIEDKGCSTTEDEMKNIKGRFFKEDFQYLGAMIETAKEYHTHTCTMFFVTKLQTSVRNE